METDEDIYEFWKRFREDIPKMRERLRTQPLKSTILMSERDFNQLLEFQKEIDVENSKFQKWQPVTIILNGIHRIVPHQRVTYENVMVWLGLPKNATISVVYMTKTEAGVQVSHILLPGQSVEAVDGAKISAVSTGDG